MQVWASLLLYRQILDEIEANDYNNFTKRAYVSKPKKIIALPIAYAKSVVPPRTPSPLTKAWAELYRAEESYYTVGKERKDL